MPEPPGPARLASTFQALRAAGRKAFIPYITAGDPDGTVTIMERLADSGADIIELGVPFSDPLADGPTIQAASWRALQRGVDVARVLAWTERFAHDRETPVVLFTYLNPVLSYGPDHFVRDAAAAGAAGLLITDLPVGEDEVLENTLASGALELVRLVAPTTRERRLRRIFDSARGFVYYISRAGVTGERRDMREELMGEIAGLRRLTDLPIAVGFGISTPEQAASAATVADGVVMGSALVRTLAEEGTDAACGLVRRVRQAIDRVTV